MPSSQPTPPEPKGLYWGTRLVVAVLSLAIALPALIYCMQLFPWIGRIGNLDPRIPQSVLFLLLASALFLVLWRWRRAVRGLALLSIIALLATGILGIYGYRDLRSDYGLMLRSIQANTHPAPMALGELKPFTGADEILASIDYQDRTVRAFAVRAATTWFTDAPIKDSEFTLVQCFSIFKVINSSWTYVSDPKGAEYFANASETVDLLAGDCDDHSILMAACIKAIGGEARLVRTTGHIYPELKVGDAEAMERAAYLIRRVLFPESAKHATLFYHVDANGDRWINMDYTRKYPGGEVMDETIKGILPV